jgi:hypothetical protein
VIDLLRLSRQLRLATLAVVVATTVAALALGRAITYAPLTPPPEDAADVPTSAGDPHAVASTRSGADDLSVRNDPFDRYRSPLDEEEIAEAPPPAEELVAPASIRLLGTVIRPAGASFAVCQLPSAVARAVAVGDSIGGMTVVEIDRGSAVLRRPDGRRVVLNLSNPGT